MSISPSEPRTPRLEDQAALPTAIAGDSAQLLTLTDTELFYPAPAPATSSRVVKRDRPRWRAAGWVAYPAVVLALVVSGVLLTSYGVDDLANQQTATDTPRTVADPPPPPSEAQQVDAARFDPGMVTISGTGIGDTGVRIVGELTDVALANPNAFSEHIAGVLTDACVNNLHLTTSDNLLVDFWGFCFASLPPEVISEALTYAVDNDVTSLSFQTFPAQENQRRISYVWQVSDPAEYDRIVESWEDIDRPRGVDDVLFSIYGTDAISDQMTYADLTEDGLKVQQGDEKSGEEN